MASWNRSLFESDVHECLRAYFAPCCVFGQTRYRLDRIDRNADPLDLDDYKTSNRACVDWAVFALPLCISCSVFTSAETRRIRMLYGIKGSHKNDVVTAVLCPCCSILRNELEVRTREEEKWNDKHGVVDEPYAAEQPMTPSRQASFSSGKENRAPLSRKNSVRSSLKSVLRYDSHRSSASSPHRTQDAVELKEQSPAGTPPPAAHKPDSVRSATSTRSLNSSGNSEITTTSCIVASEQQGQGYQHILRQLNRGAPGQLPPLIERWSEDTMSTAKKSKVCASPPEQKQAENIPLGSIQEGTPPPGSGSRGGSQGKSSAAVSSPLLSVPTSPRRSIDRPDTPIPRDDAMSPTLSVFSGRSGRSNRSFRFVHLVPPSEGVPSPVQELVEDGQTPAEEEVVYHGQQPFVGVYKGKEPAHKLPSESLSNEPDIGSTPPEVKVQGWLDDVGSPARRLSVEVKDHAFPPEMGDGRERASVDSIISNATLTPASFTPMPGGDIGTSVKAAEEARDDAVEAAPPDSPTGPKQAKKEDQPAGTLSCLSATIADAIKAVMPGTSTAVASPATALPNAATTPGVTAGTSNNLHGTPPAGTAPAPTHYFPEHNVPLPKQDHTIHPPVLPKLTTSFSRHGTPGHKEPSPNSEADKTPRPMSRDNSPEKGHKVAAVQQTDHPGSPTLPARRHSSSPSPPSPQTPKRKPPSESKIPRRPSGPTGPPAVTPAVPTAVNNHPQDNSFFNFSAAGPGPGAGRKKSSLDTATPATPAPPGTYPKTPAPAPAPVVPFSEHEPCTPGTGVGAYPPTPSLAGVSTPAAAVVAPTPGTGVGAYPPTPSIAGGSTPTMAAAASTPPAAKARVPSSTSTAPTETETEAVPQPSTLSTMVKAVTGAPSTVVKAVTGAPPVPAPLSTVVKAVTDPPPLPALPAIFHATPPIPRPAPAPSSPTTPATPAPAPPPLQPPAAVPTPPSPRSQSPFGPGSTSSPTAGPGADKGPFTTFRAKQLLGHYLARDVPKTSTDKTTITRPGHGVRGTSLCEDDLEAHDRRVWGTKPPLSRGRGGLRRGGRGGGDENIWRARGRGDRREGMGTE